MSGKWIFRDRELLKAPSVLEGKTIVEESCLRYYATHFLERCGKSLGMPQELINKGKLLMQRFYMRCSFQKWEYHEVSAALLFLCSKIGNSGSYLKIETIIGVCARAAKKGHSDLSETSKEFCYWYDKILVTEQHILEMLCFDDCPLLPHPIAIDLIRSFGGSKQLQLHAFHLCSDALYSSVSVRYTPELLAQASVYLACLATNESLKTLNGTDWKLAKRLGIRKLKVIAKEIASARDIGHLRSVTEKLVLKIEGKVKTLNASIIVPSRSAKRPTLTSPDATIPNKTPIHPKVNGSTLTGTVNHGSIPLNCTQNFKSSNDRYRPPQHERPKVNAGRTGHVVGDSKSHRAHTVPSGYQPYRRPNSLPHNTRH
ncbi:cyclin-like protein [Globomyces pollinis-pini]|nr:cyclin-like protein [Globomyces pollinis-pini]